MDIHSLIIRPIFSEKTMRDAESSKFTFEVDSSSNKKDIKKVVALKFGVDVLGVTTTIVKGRSKRIGKKMQEVVQRPWKKAVVQLKKGQKIDLFESTKE